MEMETLMRTSLTRWRIWWSSTAAQVINQRRVCPQSRTSDILNKWQQFVTQSSLSGARHRDHGASSSFKGINSGLKTYFFGEDLKGNLTVDRYGLGDASYCLNNVHILDSFIFKSHSKKKSLLWNLGRMTQRAREKYLRMTLPIFWLPMRDSSPRSVPRCSNVSEKRSMLKKALGWDSQTISTSTRSSTPSTRLTRPSSSTTSLELR